MSRVLLIIFPFWAAAFRAAALGLDGADCGVLRSRAQSLDRANAVTLARGRKRVPARGTHGRLAARSITSATHRSGLQRSERAMTRMTYISSAIIAVTLLVSVEAAAQQSGPKASAQAPWFGLWCCRRCWPTPEGIGEWGFAAVVEVDGRRWLFDTGARPETVLRNAEELRVDLGLHHRRDPPATTTPITPAGLVTHCARRWPRRTPPRSRACTSRRACSGRGAASGEAEANPMVAATRPAYEATGGPVPSSMTARSSSSLASGSRARRRRTFPGAQLERLVEGRRRLAGLVEDTLPEDQALARPHCRAASASSPAAATPASATSSRTRGLLPGRRVAVRRRRRRAPPARRRRVSTWRGRPSGRAPPASPICSAPIAPGVEALYRLRALAGLTRATAVVGAVGSGYEDALGHYVRDASPGRRPRVDSMATLQVGVIPSGQPAGCCVPRPCGALDGSALIIHAGDVGAPDDPARRSAHRAGGCSARQRRHRAMGRGPCR